MSVTNCPYQCMKMEPQTIPVIFKRGIYKNSVISFC